jgi:hypothetical protein
MIQGGLEDEFIIAFPCSSIQTLVSAREETLSDQDILAVFTELTRPVAVLSKETNATRDKEFQCRG